MTVKIPMYIGCVNDMYNSQPMCFTDDEQAEEMIQNAFDESSVDLKVSIYHLCDYDPVKGTITPCTKRYVSTLNIERKDEKNEKESIEQTTQPEEVSVSSESDQID